MEVWRRSHHLLRHTSEVLGFMLPWRSRESTCCGDEDQPASCVPVCVSVTGAGCVPVSNRACYLCRLRHGYNRGHRMLSSGWNTNLEPDLWPQGVALCLTALWALLSVGLITIWGDCLAFRFLFSPLLCSSFDLKLKNWIAPVTSTVQQIYTVWWLLLFHYPPIHLGTVYYAHFQVL